MSRIAYVFPLFPVINQTFTLGEVVWLKRRGYDVSIYSLKSGVTDQQQPEARELISQTHYCPPLLSAAMLGPFWDALRRRPRDVVALFATVWRSWRKPMPAPERVGEHAGVPTTFSLAEWADVLWKGNRFFYLAKSLSMVPYAIYLGGVLRRDGIDHMHCQWATYTTTVGMLVEQWEGIPYSFAAHAYDIYMLPRMLPEKLERSTFTVTCADYNRRYLQSVCSSEAAERVYLNYHGADLGRFRECAAPEDGRFRVISAGWFKEYKGFHFIVEAIAELVRRGVDAELHLAGDGPQRAYLESLAERLDISDRLHFHGYVDHDRLIELYGTSDAFAIGSIEMPVFGRQDVIPNVIAEAMAVGIPVVATRMGGIAELVEDGVEGALVPQRDPKAMADALEVLHADPERTARQVRAARAKIERIWDRDRNLRELAALIEHYVPGAGPAAEDGAPGDGAEVRVA